MPAKGRSDPRVDGFYDTLVASNMRRRRRRPRCATPPHDDRARATGAGATEREHIVFFSISRAFAMRRDDDEDEDDDVGYDDGDDVEDVDGRACEDLFDSSVTHVDATAALCAARDVYGFDLRAHVARDDASGEWEFYGAMKVLNYVRATAARARAVDGDVAPSAIASMVRDGCERGDYKDEVYFTPVLSDDALLFDWETYANGGDDEAEDVGATAGGFDVEAAAQAMRKLSMENEELRVRLFEVMTSAGMVDEASIAAAFSPVVAQGTEESTAGTATAAAIEALRIDEQATKTTATPSSDTRTEPQTAEEKLKQDVDDDYFGSYSTFDIHRDMIGDTARTESYRDALERNPSLIKGKKVLDIGCGTGILSMFAARGGASKVVGVDGAKHIAQVARANIKHNGFDADGSSQIQIVQGKLEDIKDGIPGAPFDVLVSEWMGYGLLFEAMLDTVLEARDRYLKPGGAVLPDIATIHIAGFDREATSFPFWDNVYDFKMPEISKQLLEGAMKTAVVTHVDGARVTTESAQVCELDLASCSIADTEFTAEFSVCAKSERKGHETHGIVLWFDTEFSKRFCKENPVMLSTSPYALKTHWVQTMLHFPDPIVLGDEITDLKARIGSSAHQGAEIVGRISMVKSKRPRAYDISLEYRAKSSNGDVGPLRVALYAL